MQQHEYKGKLAKCMTCFRMKEDPIHSTNNNIRQEKEVVLYGSNDKPIPPCPGHRCPKCQRVWDHAYNCGQDTSREGLCFDCAQQNAAEINRPAHIEEIKVNGQAGFKHLTAFEAKELNLQHEEFVVLNIIHDATTKEVKPDWQAKLSEHIQQLEKIIEQKRIQISASRSAKAAQEVQDLNKLTPEEQEQYRRDAVKTKKKKEAIEKEKVEKATVTGSKRDKMIASLLKLQGMKDTPENRSLVEAMLS